MSAGVAWLAITDLRRNWARGMAAAVVIAVGVWGVGFFADQASKQQTAVGRGYEQVGAASFVVELDGVDQPAVAGLVQRVNRLDGVRSAAISAEGLPRGIVADTSFVVFANAQQREFLGARSSMLGVQPGFQPPVDYFVNFHDTNPTAPDAALGIPLLPQTGSSVPGRGEMLIDTAVASYIGVAPGATGSVDLIYPGTQPPIVRHLDNIRLAGTFHAIGPDQGRVDGFWGLALQGASAGNNVLMVRQPGTGAAVSTVPVILDAATVRSFEGDVRAQLTQRGQKIPAAWGQTRMVIHASSLTAVPRAQRAVAALLAGGGLAGQRPVSWRVLMPEQNNYLAAQREQTKIGHGATFFLGLLALLIATGTAGLAIRVVLGRWRQYGILQAIGFTPMAVVAVLGIQLTVVLGSAIGLAGLASAVFPGQMSGMALLWAAGLCVAATALGAVPALVWPLRYGPAAALRETA
jgi:hypothetical protein